MSFTLLYHMRRPNIPSAAETAARSGKKTVMPADVFAAMNDLEFSFMLPRLEAEVTKFTSIQADKRNTYRKKVREVKKAQNGPEHGDGGVDVVAGAQEGGDDEERAAKRAKVDAGASEEDEEGDGDVDETADVEDEEVEDDEIEEDEEGGEGEGEGLVEDALEEREDKEDDDDMQDGEESD